MVSNFNNFPLSWWGSLERSQFKAQNKKEILQKNPNFNFHLKSISKSMQRNGIDKVAIEITKHTSKTDN